MIAAAILTGVALAGGVAYAFCWPLAPRVPTPKRIEPDANVSHFGPPLIDYASKRYLTRKWWRR